MKQWSQDHCGKEDVHTIGYLQPNMAGTSNDQILWKTHSTIKDIVVFIKMHFHLLL